MMKRDDFSHSEPVIYIEKDFLTAIAFTLKDGYKVGYLTALNTVAHYLCGTNLDFQEFHKQHRYDLTLEQAMAAFPDVLDLYCDRLCKATGLRKHYVMSVLSTPEKCLCKKNMASLYEHQNGLAALVPCNAFAELMNQKKSDAKSFIDLCNDLDSALADKSPWEKSNRLELYTEISSMVKKLRYGQIAKRKQERVIIWCKEQIEKILNQSNNELKHSGHAHNVDYVK